MNTTHRRIEGSAIQGVVSQSLTTQKTKITSVKQKIKKRGLLETILGAIALFQIQFSPSRSPTPISAITKPDCVIKGNISIATGAKFYHVPGMEDYDGTIIDAEKGERWFCSESEAVAAGWRRAPR